jgi:hypothetical protein
MRGTQTLQEGGIAGLPSRLPAILRLLAALLVLGCGSAAFAQDADLDPRIAKLVASVSDERLGVILKKLESFETRSTLSSTASTTRGIGAARQWILDEMKAGRSCTSASTAIGVPQDASPATWNCAT